MTERKAYIKSWPRQNLAELLQFLEQRHPGGLKLRDFSERSGLTQQYASSIFRRDDMRLSLAEKIADTYGYQLKLYFPQKEYKFGIVPEGLSKYRKDYPNAGNLSGLAKYMQDSMRTINSLSEAVGLNYSVIKDAFNKGDIYISTLYKILKNLNIQVLWSFEKK